jgi:hypothetical protein
VKSYYASIDRLTLRSVRRCAMCPTIRHRGYHGNACGTYVTVSDRLDANVSRASQTPHPPAEKSIFSPGPSRKCRAFFHSGCSVVRQTPPSHLGVVLKCYKDADYSTVRSQADGIVDGLSAALHDVTGRPAITWRPTWIRSVRARSALPYWRQRPHLHCQRQVSPTETDQMGRTKNGFKISSAQIMTRIRLGS